MILIKDIQIINLSDEEYELIEYKGFGSKFFKGLDEKLEPVEITREMITGNVFKNINGEKICLGMSKKIQDVLGLPFKAFTSLQKKISDQQKNINVLYSINLELRNQLEKFQTMTFWKRLKFLLNW